jgi:hypothetical protein
MQTMQKEFINNKIDQLKSIIDNRQTNLDVYRDLFTNQFAFFMFNKFMQTVHKPKVRKVTVKPSSNVFLIYNNWLFGVNDDGKIFCVHLNSRPLSLRQAYGSLGYHCDILDDPIRKKIQVVENVITLNFDQRMLKKYSGKWVRVVGDLRMQFFNDGFIHRHFANLLLLYINELWMQKLSEYGFINSTTGIPTKVNNKLRKLAFDELISVLKAINFNIIDIQPVESSNDINVLCKFSDVVFNILFRYDSMSDGYNFVLNFQKKNSNVSDFVKNVLQTVGINPKEQDIIINLGNHKIILHGYYFPLISVGTLFLSLDRFLARKVILQHPEHHEVQINFSDLVEITFDTLVFSRQHMMLRNEYFANKIK